MGSFRKQKRSIKNMFLAQAQKEVSRLQAENKAIKEDPNSVVGQFIGQYNDVISQNQKLSTLACALLTQGGGKVRVLREEIDVFKGKRLKIHIEVPEGVEKFDDSSEYTFSFSAEDVQPTAPVAMEVPCVDSNCTLPKDFVHSHTAPDKTEGQKTTERLLAAAEDIKTAEAIDKEFEGMATDESYQQESIKLTGSGV
jgi:hypothetical protein